MATGSNAVGWRNAVISVAGHSKGDRGSRHGRQAALLGLFRSVDAAEWTRMIAAYCEDARYERPGYPALIGHVEILDFYMRVRTVAFGEHRLEHIMISGDHGACWGTFVGQTKGGLPVDESFCDVYSFHADKIWTRRTFFFRPAI
jgi:ketosteroid isomerase-like protein